MPVILQEPHVYKEQIMCRLSESQCENIYIMQEDAIYLFFVNSSTNSIENTDELSKIQIVSYRRLQPRGYRPLPAVCIHYRINVIIYSNNHQEYGHLLAVYWLFFYGTLKKTAGQKGSHSNKLKTPF